MAKKVTKAELIQEWSARSFAPVPPTRYSQEPVLPIYMDRGRDVLYRPDPSGCLAPWASCPQVWGAGVRLCQSGGHVLAVRVDIRSNARTRLNGERLREESALVLLWDSEGTLPCPFSIDFDGRIAYQVLLPLADGGLMALLNGPRYDPPATLNQLTRYSAAGEVLWTRDLHFAEGALFCPGGAWLKKQATVNGQNAGEFAFLDLEGNECSRFQTAEAYRRNPVFPEHSDDLWIISGPNCDLVRLDRTGRELDRVPLPGGDERFYPAGDRLLCGGYRAGVYLLERDSFRVLASLPGQPCGLFLGRDGQGRLWFQERMVTCYDGGLNFVSRHRLKGSVQGGWLDSEDRLCAVTWHAAEEMIRVYRLS